MRARRARFVTSAAAPRQFPPPTHPEIAFAGRSNVGKSSLINALTGVSGLARTSSTPGRTRLLNWFEVAPPRGPELAFVDLPGYGYARVSRSMRDAWRPLIEAYLSRREALALLVLIVDLRRGPEEEEAQLLEWLARRGRPARVVLTKADKVPKSRRRPAQDATRKLLSLPRPPLLFSAETGEGAGELWRDILSAVKS